MSPPQEQDPGIASLDPMPGRVDRRQFSHREADRRGRDGERLQGAAAVAEQAGRGEDPAPPPAQGRRLVARFKREAKSASLLNHPNSIQIIDSGEDSDGTLYIAMELLTGRDLAQVIRDDFPLPLLRIGRIMSQVLNALDEAHAHGVDPPRPQAEQHHADRAPRREGLRQGVRLRHRQGDAGRRRGRPLGDAHHPGPGVRHARIHVSRAGARRTAGRARGPVFGGGRSCTSW